MSPFRPLLTASLVASFASLASTAIVACSDSSDGPSGVDGGTDGSNTDGEPDPALDGAAEDAADAGDSGASDDAGDASSDADAGDLLRIRFEAKVGALPFACGAWFPAVGTPPREMTPVDFRFYVHDVRLVDGAGTEVPLTLKQGSWQHKDVALLDFEDGAGACADGDAPKNVEIVGSVPQPFTATGLKFRVGVPQSLNHEDLSTQPPPLDKSSLFWAWQSGHIFFAAVGRVRLPVDGGAGTTPFNHYTHVGSVGCVGNPASGIPITSCAKPNRPEIVLTGFDPETKKVVVDFAAVKAGTDLASKGCHADGDHCATAYTHLGIDWSTGGYTDTQNIFGVE